MLLQHAVSMGPGARRQTVPAGVASLRRRVGTGDRGAELAIGAEEIVVEEISGQCVMA